MRSMVAIVAMALLFSGCGDHNRDRRDALRNEVITFRIAAEPNVMRPDIVLAAYQRLETAITIARADGLKLPPDTDLALDELLKAGEEAKKHRDADNAARLWAQSIGMEALLKEAQ